jgi:subtilase family serine protease
MHFAITAAQQSRLQQILEAQQTRGSKEYHKWLTPEQYGQMFGLSSSDINKVTNWLQQQGFSNIEVARSRDSVSFSGNATLAQAAFQTSIQQYTVDGVTHFANSTAPQLPRALQGVVESIRGLNDIAPHPLGASPAALHAHYTSAGPSSVSGNSHFLVPYDFATMYDIGPLYGAGTTGNGEKIAVAGQYDISSDQSDITQFRSVMQLPANTPTLVSVSGSTPGTALSDFNESMINVEWSGAIAYNATVVYVAAGDAFTAATYAIDQNLAPVVLLTYGHCEALWSGSNEITTLNNEFQKANSQGITVVVPSGDLGAADCDAPTSSTPPTTASHGPAVDFPASSPYVTAVGGTELNDCNGSYWNSTNNQFQGSVTGYIPEVAWNDTTTPAVSCGQVSHSENGVKNILAASGGGASTVNSKPTWQTGPGVPNDNFRDVPDVAFAASPYHDPYLYCFQGVCQQGLPDPNKSSVLLAGGTATVSAAFAGVVALLDEAQKSSGLGNINQRLYQIAGSSSSAFHDITSGSNEVPCASGSTGCGSGGTFGFTAGAGYDQVTGLGSIDVNALASEWGSDFSLTLTPSTVSVAPGASATSSVAVSAVNNFNGNVTFSCSVASTLANVSCSVPGSVTGSGSVTVTVTAATSAAAPRFRPFGGFTAGKGPMLFGFLLMLFSCFAAWFLMPRRTWRIVTVAAGLSCFALLSSCGGGGGGGGGGNTGGTSSVGPAESGTVTVTATSGSVAHTAALTVNVT